MKFVIKHRGVPRMDGGNQWVTVSDRMSGHDVVQALAFIVRTRTATNSPMEDYMIEVAD